MSFEAFWVPLFETPQNKVEAFCGFKEIKTLADDFTN